MDSGTMDKALAKILMMWLAWNVCPAQARPWTVNPQQNIWVTLANMTRQDSLSMATPKDPFRTCLIGISIYDF